MLADPNSPWLFEPERGLLLQQQVMINNSGNYICVGTMNNISTVKNFTISVKGILLF
jgi:hypothetical protein